MLTKSNCPYIKKTMGTISLVPRNRHPSFELIFQGCKKAPFVYKPASAVTYEPHNSLAVDKRGRFVRRESTGSEHKSATIRLKRLGGINAFPLCRPEKKNERIRLVPANCRRFDPDSNKSPSLFQLVRFFWTLKTGSEYSYRHQTFFFQNVS